MHYHFFKNRFLYFRAWIKQTKHIVMMTNEGSTKIVNLMTSMVFELGCGHINTTLTIQFIYAILLNSASECVCFTNFFMFPLFFKLHFFLLLQQIIL